MSKFSFILIRLGDREKGRGLNIQKKIKKIEKVIKQLPTWT